MKEGGRTGACPWWEGVGRCWGGGRGGFAPLEIKKGKANIGQLVRWGVNRRNLFVL